MSSKRIKRTKPMGHSLFCGQWNGREFLVNDIAQPDVTKRLLLLGDAIQHLAGEGHLMLATSDGERYQTDVPFENGDFLVWLGKAIMTFGRLDIRMHQHEGKDQLYGVLLGRRTWKGCTAEELGDSFLTCPCCGTGEGADCLDEANETLCQWPEYPVTSGAVN